MSMIIPGSCLTWPKCGREKGTDALEYSIFFALLDPAQGPDCHRSWGSSRQMERSNGQTVKLSSPRWDMSTCWFFDWKLISWIEAPNSHRQNVSANLQLLFSDIPWPHVTAQPTLFAASIFRHVFDYQSSQKGYYPSSPRYASRE